MIKSMKCSCCRMAVLKASGCVCERGVHTNAVGHGATISVIDETTHNHIEQESGLPNPLQPTDKTLRSNSGHSIQVLFKARYGDKEIVVPVDLHVVSGDGLNLMGRDWLSHLDVSLTTLNLIDTDRQLLETLDKYPDMFTDELGCVLPVRLIVREDAQPKFYKPTPVPFSLREKVEKELANLQIFTKHLLVRHIA